MFNVYKNVLLYKFSKYFVKGLSQVVTFEIIDAQTAAELSDFDAAMEALKAAQVKGDINAIKDALVTVQICAQNLGHSDGSALH